MRCSWKSTYSQRLYHLSFAHIRMRADWLQSAAVTLLATLAAVWDHCPGLIEHPEPRHEPWNIKFAKDLAEEVREADSGKVSLLGKQDKLLLYGKDCCGVTELTPKMH